MAETRKNMSNEICKFYLKEIFFDIELNTPEIDKLMRSAWDGPNRGEILAIDFSALLAVPDSGHIDFTIGRSQTCDGIIATLKFDYLPTRKELDELQERIGKRLVKIDSIVAEFAKFVLENSQAIFDQELAEHNGKLYKEVNEIIGLIENVDPLSATIENRNIIIKKINSFLKKYEHFGNE